MYVFGSQSEKHLAGVTPALVRVCRRALELGSKVGCDFSVIDGLRTPAEAQANVAKGVSQTSRSKHLPGPDGLARAVDLRPWPRVQNGLTVDANDWMRNPDIFRRWAVLDTLMRLAAAEEGVRLRWGADWDSDGRVTDHTLADAYHWELV